jgi:hypothetical protein
MATPLRSGNKWGFNLSAPKSENPAATGQNANQNSNDDILPTAENVGKQIATLQARFALLGHTLQTAKRENDGRVTYTIARWGQSRSFTHLHDVQAFLAQIGGAK